MSIVRLQRFSLNLFDRLYLYHFIIFIIRYARRLLDPSLQHFWMESIQTRALKLR